jgi:hypothetical protein
MAASPLAELNDRHQAAIAAIEGGRRERCAKRSRTIFRTAWACSAAAILPSNPARLIVGLQRTQRRL